MFESIEKYNLHLLQLRLMPIVKNKYISLLFRLIDLSRQHPTKLNSLAQIRSLPKFISISITEMSCQFLFLSENTINLLEESLAEFKNGDKKQRHKIIDWLVEQTCPESSNSHKHRKVGTWHLSIYFNISTNIPFRLWNTGFITMAGKGLTRTKWTTLSIGAWSR